MSRSVCATRCRTSSKATDRYEIANHQYRLAVQAVFLFRSDLTSGSLATRPQQPPCTHLHRTLLDDLLVSRRQGWVRMAQARLPNRWLIALAAVVMQICLG